MRREEKKLEEKELLPSLSILHSTVDASFEVIMEKHLYDVYRLCCWFIQDKIAAEDVTQEVFLRAYKSLPGFRGESKVETWLYRIAINESKRYLRSWSIRHIFYQAEPGVQEFIEIEEGVVRKEEWRRLATVIAKLPFRHRQIIILHYYEELTIEEIAEILEISSGAVYTRLHRAREKLKALLNKGGEEWT